MEMNTGSIHADYRMGWKEGECVAEASVIWDTGGRGQGGRKHCCMDSRSLLDVNKAFIFDTKSKPGNRSRPAVPAVT